MKTTLQEIVDDLKIELETNIIAYHEISIMKWVIRILESKLEKEKEQNLNLICFMRTNNKMGKSVEDLYNEFYNQNK